jgi:hypothetical protein
VRQCLIYDAPTNPARLIGVECMITPKLYETLDNEERKLWHSHDFEVSGIEKPTSFHQSNWFSWAVSFGKKDQLSFENNQVRSGMLIMPNPNVPNAVWEIAETEEMKEVIGLYGKTYHFWQVDNGDTLPLGKPELMMSFTKPEQVSRLRRARI